MDSGQIVLVDPCYVMKTDNPRTSKDQITYEKMLKTAKEVNTQELVFTGIAGNGVLVRGFGGDGSYPVYARIEDGLVKEVKIVFNV